MIDRTPLVQLTPGLPPAIAPGTRVKLPRSGRIGITLAPAWSMPLHTLVNLDGDRQWVLTEILEVQK